MEKIILILAASMCVVVGLMVPQTQAEQWLKLTANGGEDDEDPVKLRLPCTYQEPGLSALNDDCRAVKYYNQTELTTQYDEVELFRLAENCACQLYNMHESWAAAFDDEETRRVSTMVKNIIASDEHHQKHPEYLWSDIDVVFYKVSIYTATKDYFEQQANNKSMALPAKLRQRLDKEEQWQIIKRVCRKVARDPAKLYRYMENLGRISPGVFFRLTVLSEPIDMIYQASKSCKLLLMLKLRDYKLRPDRLDFIPVDLPNTLETQSGNSDLTNSMVSNDIDTMLRGASALLLNCERFQRQMISLQALARNCPMMVSEKVPSEWIAIHPSPLERSSVAVQCGCQLLLHSSTWDVIMKDPNVQIMSKALTNYMNQNRVPDFTKAPVWSIYGWFNEIMAKFSKNRKMSIKEVVKTISNDQDPRIIINQSTRTHDAALELLRRGCMFIVFNYNKGSKQASELKLIKYLDNLQQISQDPMFVFHLTLQDTNLFKLYALSKMCEPIVT